MAFISSAMYSIDAKKRIVVPNIYREELGDVFYVTRSLDSCLTIYPKSQWDLLIDKLNKLPNTASADAREYFMSLAQKCTPDASGRILLDSKLLEHARISKNAVFVGAGNTINVWSEEQWIIREASRNLDGIRSYLQDNGL